METKLNRIAAFIESLPMDSKLSEMQGSVISTELNLIGAGGVNKNKICSNSSLSCVDATNENGCVNIEGFCDQATNSGGCKNISIQPHPNLNVENC